MPYADPLTDDEIERGLASLDGWTREADAIRRTITCRDFRGAIALVDAVADAAEAANHHPDIEVRRYRRVTFTLSTHAAKAITARDLELAAEIDGLAARIGAA
jgi:4a-hydroxytetrahydrobiopterin dehydratase